MLYHVDLAIHYATDMTQQEFLSIWLQDAEALLGAKADGIVVDAWKCVGQRRVIAIVQVDSPEMLDQILLDLPMMKAIGQHLAVTVTPLRPYRDFAEDIKARLKA
ncbi:MAG: muconolactone Delta-isomerase family protein [Cyanobacteria bacterium P01_G01_bin.54]